MDDDFLNNDILSNSVRYILENSSIVCRMKSCLFTINAMESTENVMKMAALFGIFFHSIIILKKKKDLIYLLK